MIVESYSWGMVEQCPTCVRLTEETGAVTCCGKCEQLEGVAS